VNKTNKVFLISLEILVKKGLIDCKQIPLVKYTIYEGQSQIYF
jgi:hypothetical protein